MGKALSRLNRLRRKGRPRAMTLAQNDTNPSKFSSMRCVTVPDLSRRWTLVIAQSYLSLGKRATMRLESSSIPVK